MLGLDTINGWISAEKNSDGQYVLRVEHDIMGGERIMDEAEFRRFAEIIGASGENPTVKLSEHPAHAVLSRKLLEDFAFFDY